MSLAKNFILVVATLCLISLSLAESNFFIPKRCPQVGGIIPQRFGPAISGCVCYRDGRCEYSTDQSRSELCFYSGAISVNENEQCPTLNGGKLFVCPHKPIWPPPPVTDEDTATEIADFNFKRPDFKVNCPSYVKKGCICYHNGTCIKSSNVNQCVNCQDESILSIIEDGDCPVKTSTTKVGPCKLKTAPGAYICTPDDRSLAKMCPMYMAMNGCICYKDGTCKSSSTNRCTECVNSNVVSVLEGKDCICE